MAWNNFSPAEKVQFLGKTALAKRTGGDVWILENTYADKAARDLMPLVDRFIYNCDGIEISEKEFSGQPPLIVFHSFSQSDYRKAVPQMGAAGITETNIQYSHSRLGHRMTIGLNGLKDISPAEAAHEVEAIRNVLERLSAFNSRLGGAVLVTLNCEVLNREVPTPQYPLGSLKISSAKVAVPA